LPPQDAAIQLLFFVVVVVVDVPDPPPADINDVELVDEGLDGKI
jgi:hypothetical protein